MSSKCLKVFLIVGFLLFAYFSFLPTVKADNPVSEYTLTFSSAGDLNKFFKTHNFYIAKYDKNKGEWKEDAYLSKDLIFHEGTYYVIAPYFYDDENGYPHLIEQSGAIITLEDINLPNATIIITGFDNSMITIKNVRSHVVVGKLVPYEGNGIYNQNVPWWAYIPMWGGLIYEVSNTVNYYTIRHGSWYGTVNTIITVSETTNVKIENFYVTNDVNTPIVVKDSGNAVLENVHINPPQVDIAGGSAVYMKNVENFTTNETVSVSGYATAFELHNVRTFFQKGALYIDGKYYDENEEKYGGVGIYADKVGNYTAIQEHVNAWGVFQQGAEGDAFYNSTNGTVWGALNFTVIIFHNGKNNGTETGHNATEFYAVKKKINFVANATEKIYTDKNGTVHGYLVFRKPISVKFNEKNESLKVDIEGNYTIKEGKIVYMESKEVGNNTTVESLKFYEEGITEPEAKVKGSLAHAVYFMYLRVGIAVPDDGSQEKELIDKMNATANFVVVDERVRLFSTYQNEVYNINVASAFAGMTAIVSVFVAVGWVRVGTMLLSADPHKKKEGKDLMMKAAIGTIIVAFVLFGWANALGLFNWVMGG